MGGKSQILHIDMNAFYASCHVAEDASYVGKAIAVAGSQELRHGIIVTASYEARAFGVKTAMTVYEARKLCPKLTLIQPDFTVYRSYAKKVFDIVRRFTPLVEIVSIDECYADVTGSRQFGDSLEIASRIQNTIRDELKLPCSIGVSFCKFFAKMASNLKKPMGITQIDEENVEQRLWPLPVEDIHGVGKKTAEKLKSLGIHTMAGVACADDQQLRSALGSRGHELREYVLGHDDRPVSPEQNVPKSIGHSVTLPADAKTCEPLARILLNLSDQVGRRLRKHHLVGRSLTLTIRFSNLETIQRRMTLGKRTDLTESIYEGALELLTRHWKAYRPIRLIGVTIGDLSTFEEDAKAGIQLDLFGAKQQEQAYTQLERLRRLTKTTDSLRDKFGENIVVRATMLQSDKSNALRDHRSRGTSLQKDQLYEEE